METTLLQDQKNAASGARTSQNKYSFTFSSFQKAIKANSEIRQQIKDLVDLGLFEYAFSRNNTFIQTVQKKAEAESIELMMRFANGVDDLQKLKNRIHRNRVIRTLAMLDRKDQSELINKLTHTNA